MLVLKSELTLESNDTCSFKDTTGQLLTTAYSQGGNIDYSNVTAIRLKIGNYSTVEYPSPPTADGFIQYTEYQKIGGDPEAINDKTFYSGDYFVPQFTGLTTNYPENWETTGYYVYPYLDSWLPTVAEVPLDITIGQLGQSGQDIEDNEYVYEYEVYDNPQETTQAAVDGDSYIVFNGYNDDTIYVTYNGNKYYGGETFIATDTTDIVPEAGTAFATLYAATTGYSTMVYSIEERLNQLIEQQIGKGNQDLVNPQYGFIIKMKTKLEALQYSAKTQNVSLLYCWNTINAISQKLDELIIP